MGKNTVLLCAVLGVGLVSAVLYMSSSSEEHDHADDHIEHYQSAEISNKEHALEVLRSNNSKIASILQESELDSTALESIHEISYSLEAAIDKLISEKAGDKKILESVDEAIQAVHYASEKHEEARVREWFAKLEPAAGKINISGDHKSSKSQQTNSYEIIIKNHIFSPNEVRVPAGEKVKLIVHNQDPTPEEFESDDFRREKIIAGNSKATIFVGPLEPGKYHFFGEFNLDKANGYLIAE